MRTRPASSPPRSPLSLLPGLILACLLAGAAIGGAQLAPLPPVLIGLILGMAAAPFAGDPRLAPGLAVSAREVLRFGVAILGAQVTLGQIAALGWPPILIALAGLIVCLIGGFRVARRIGLSDELALLTAGAVAICGASAALAIAAVLPKSQTLEQSTATTVAGITIIGTIGMIAFPLLARTAGFDDAEAGIFLGASLHEVVQAVAAGFAFSDGAGETAATVKLIRVACIAPVVAAAGWWLSRKGEQASGDKPPLLPVFLIGFLVLAALASLGAIPQALLGPLAWLARFCLTVAIVAFGTRISLSILLRAGSGTMVAILLQSVLIAAVVLAGLLLLAAGAAA